MKIPSCYIIPNVPWMQSWRAIFETVKKVVWDIWTRLVTTDGELPNFKCWAVQIPQRPAHVWNLPLPSRQGSILSESSQNTGMEKERTRISTSAWRFPFLWDDLFSSSLWSLEKHVIEQLHLMDSHFHNFILWLGAHITWPWPTFLLLLNLSRWEIVRKWRTFQISRGYLCTKGFSTP